MDIEKLKEVLTKAVMVVEYRAGDVSTEDGTYATTDTDEIIRLEAALCDALGTKFDDIDLAEALELIDALPDYKAERDALLAEREQLLVQEPVAVMGNNGRTQAKHEFSDIDSFLRICRNNTALYAQAVPAQQAKEIEVTDQMANAFNQAICDDAMNDQDIEEVKTGLRAAISHLQPLPKSFYELEIGRLVAINDSLLANERRMLDRMRTMQPAPAVAVPDDEPKDPGAAYLQTFLNDARFDGMVNAMPDALIQKFHSRLVERTANMDDWKLVAENLEEDIKKLSIERDASVNHWKDLYESTRQDLEEMHDKYPVDCALKPSPRITEQDARPIKIDTLEMIIACLERIADGKSIAEEFAKEVLPEARALLNKLNAKPESVGG